MTVVETIKKYGLELFEKSYQNQYGNFCNPMNLEELKDAEVKSIDIHFPTNHVTITIIKN